mgnify:FL=1
MRIGLRQVMQVGALLWFGFSAVAQESATNPESVELTCYKYAGLQAEGPLTMGTFYRDGANFVAEVFAAEPSMDQLIAERTVHDDPDIYNDDCVELFISTEEENYFHLIANTLGTVYDRYHTPFKTLDWTSNAAVEVDGGSTERVVQADGWRMRVQIPIENLLSSASIPAWRINLCRTRHAVEPTRYYTLKGWYHRPHEWLKAEFLGDDKVDAASLMPVSVAMPVPDYDRNRLERLHPGLDWIRSEKIRIYTGWAMDTFRWRTRERAEHTVYEVLDKVAEAGFNCVTVGPVLPLGWVKHEYTFDCAVSTACYARLKGLRVIWHCGYLNQTCRGENR